MQSRYNFGGLEFSPNFSFDKENIFLNGTVYLIGTSPIPIEKNFLLLNNDNFLLLSGHNLELL